MIKTSRRISALVLAGLLVFSGTSYAYWIWTPETKKFTNPKYAVKDSPKEQFDWAMSFYNAKDFQRAVTEFEKLAKQYEFSEYASKSQYYVGLCYENMQKYYSAFENYQKAIDNFPHLSNTEEIIAREYNIGLIYLNKTNPKVLGTDIMAPLDRAAEIFKKIVDNAPYGKYAQDAQFRLGETLKKAERYEEAVQAFHKIVEDYPKSQYTNQAMFEEADSAYRASLKPAYDAAATDNAIKTFEKFVNKNKDTGITKDADTTMKRLKDNVAEKSFSAAEFYESQGQLKAAVIYYQDVIDSYPESSFAVKARAKIDGLKNREQKKAAALLEAGKKKSQAIADRAARKQKIIEDREARKQALIAEKESKLMEQEARKTEQEARKRKIIAEREAQKREPWKPFAFLSKKSVEKAPPAPEVEKAQKTKAWKPIGLEAGKPEEVKEVVVAAPAQEPVVVTPAVQVTETPKTKVWRPLNFDYKKADTVTQEAPKKKPWKLFDLGAEKPEKAVPAVRETPKAKTWKPLNFDDKTADDATNEVRKKGSWKPLNFDGKASGEAKDWKPWNLNKV